MLFRLAAVLMVLSPALAYAQRDLKDIPDPDPELERKSFVVAEGFEVNLFAADPQMAKPIQMNFDAEGQLWIASSEVYPHIKPGQVANDKVLVLKDEDGDGQADSSRVFADGLLIPTGVVPGDGGVYVANSTELIHLSDTDGDGKADRRRVVLSGFGTEDTHHLLHTLRWGPDGAMYMNQSIYIHSHVETPYGVKHLNGGGIWRFRPETLQLEVLCRGFVNPWGHHFDRWGQSFATDGAYREGINYVFPGAVFFSAPGAKRTLTGLNPGSPKHCGLEVVSGRHFPESWQGNMITNDFRAHRVCRFVVSEDGAGFAARQEVEVIKSTHVAFRPIDVKMGPDGAIYVADWYNPIIQHGEVDFRDPRRDHVHGRIWRVTRKGQPLLNPPALVEATDAELLESLKAPEQWTRLHAKLILKDRGSQVRTAAAEWLAGLDADDPDYDHHRLEVMWLYECLGQPDTPLITSLAKSEDHRVRAAALRAVAHLGGNVAGLDGLLAVGVEDDHPRVRLEAARALALNSSVDSARLALRLLERPMDRFLDFALWQTMRDLSPQWLPEVLAGRLDFAETTDGLLFALQSVDSREVVGPLLNLVREGGIPSSDLVKTMSLIAKLAGPAELQQLFHLALDTNRPEVQRASMLASLASANIRGARPKIPESQVAQLLDSDSPLIRAAAARLAGAWKFASLRPRLVGWATAEPEPAEVRQSAMDALAALGGEPSIQALQSIAAGDSSEQIRAAAISALSELNTDMAAQQAVKLLAELDDPAPLMSALMRHKQGPAALGRALGQQQLDADLAKRMVRAVRRSSQPDEALIAAIRRAGQLETRGWQLTPPLLQELVTEVGQKGDPVRGEAIYRRDDLQCIKCHAIAGAGGRVGPDLISVGASAQVDYLIESMLSPNAKVKENFHAITVQGVDGRVFSGVPARRNDKELVLRDAEDRLVVIPIEAIAEEKESRSLMPDGSVDELTRQELVDLVRFMSELGKVGPFAVGTTPVVRRWQTLVWTSEANRRLNRTSFDIAATDDEALSWKSAYSRVSGELPLADLPRFKPHREVDSTSFLRCYLDVTTAGKVVLKLNSEEGLMLWIDGKPTKVGTMVEVELGRGRHAITVAVNQRQRKQPLRLELGQAPEGGAESQIIGGK